MLVKENPGVPSGGAAADTETTAASTAAERHDPCIGGILSSAADDADSPGPRTRADYMGRGLARTTWAADHGLTRIISVDDRAVSIA
jgi:hypothetical protein